MVKYRLKELKDAETTGTNAHGTGRTVACQTKHIAEAVLGPVSGRVEITKMLDSPPSRLLVVLERGNWFEDKDGDGVHYELESVIHHRGSSISSGHYTSSVLVGADWFHFNDGDDLILLSAPPPLPPTAASDQEHTYILIYKCGQGLSASAISNNSISYTSSTAVDSVSSWSAPSVPSTSSLQLQKQTDVLSTDIMGQSENPGTTTSASEEVSKAHIPTDGKASFAVDIQCLSTKTWPAKPQVPPPSRAQLAAAPKQRADGALPFVTLDTQPRPDIAIQVPPNLRAAWVDVRRDFSDAKQYFDDTLGLEILQEIEHAPPEGCRGVEHLQGYSLDWLEKVGSEDFLDTWEKAVEQNAEFKENAERWGTQQKSVFKAARGRKGPAVLLYGGETDKTVLKRHEGGDRSFVGWTQRKIDMAEAIVLSLLRRDRVLNLIPGGRTYCSLPDPCFQKLTLVASTDSNAVFFLMDASLKNLAPGLPTESLLEYHCSTYAPDINLEAAVCNMNFDKNLNDHMPVDPATTAAYLDTLRTGQAFVCCGTIPHQAMVDLNTFTVSDIESMVVEEVTGGKLGAESSRRHRPATTPNETAQNLAILEDIICDARGMLMRSIPDILDHIQAVERLWMKDQQEFVESLGTLEELSLQGPFILSPKRFAAEVGSLALQPGHDPVVWHRVVQLTPKAPTLGFIIR
ncbi:hypothetical protein C8F01DRAFT_1076463 [Mycena amicta]|nr:hypothetical protein C8F01DRAFT_1076463 [Mycena amicta]